MVSSNVSLTFERPYRSIRYRLLNCGGTALSSVGIPLAPLNEESLLEQAQQLARLSDFGDESFRVPLRILLASLKEEAQLNFIGRTIQQKNLLRLLVNRLRLQEDFKRYPQIATVPIEKPLFILGLPRSGTTFLHNLLSQDPNCRWLHLWELFNPSPPPDDNTKESDPRIGEAQEIVASYNSLAPQLSIAHDLNPNGPEECNVLFEHDFVSILFELRTHVPSYSDWLSEQDLLTSYQYYRQQLQLLAWKWSRHHWTLKAPVHLAYLSTLMTVFPDARIIYTHRDPLKVLPSLCSLSALVRGIYSDRNDPKSIGQYWLKWLSNGIEKSMSMRQTVPSQQIYDLNYLDLLAEPIGTVRKIYEQLNYPFTVALEENLKRYISENPQYKHGIHRYSLEQFGLDSKKVRQQFESYTQRFNIPLE
jgi:Sulfotransferase family